MSYSTLSYSPNEILTSAKMNQASDNDEALKDGTAIDNDAILERHVADGELTYDKMDMTTFVRSTSTEEIIGKWIDGKTIYRKVISLGAGPNATTKNIAHGVSVGQLISLYGYAGTRIFPVYPTSTASTSIIGTLRINGSDLVWHATYNATSETGYAIMEYTKP